MFHIVILSYRMTKYGWHFDLFWNIYFHHIYFINRGKIHKIGCLQKSYIIFVVRSISEKNHMISLSNNLNNSHLNDLKF